MEGKKATKRECPTLQNLCLSVICDSIQRGVPLHFPDKLNTPISDLIFNNLHIPHLAIPEKSLKIIENYFSISHITLGQNNYDENHRDMVVASNTITKLELLSLKNSLITKPNPNGKKKGRGKSLDFNLFITKLLSASSRALMESLIIQGAGCAFPQGWIGDLNKTLPALTFLDITGCSLANDEFKLLCQTYRKLTSLSIGRTNVNDLTGIEELEGLTFLSLEDLEYKKETCFYSVFLLKNLVVLNVSSNVGSAKTAELLTKRRTPLPQLQFLDCCGNKLTADTVKVLFRQNPKLQNIAVINTTYNRTLPAELVQFKEGAKFFNVSDLASCSDSLMIYHSHEERSKKILSRINQLIRNDIVNQNLQDIKKCGKALILVLLSAKQPYENQKLALKAFFNIFSSQTVLSMFNKKEKEEIARAVVKVIAVTDWFDSRQPGHMLVTVATNVLLNFGILGDDPELIKLVSFTMLKTFAKKLRFHTEHILLSSSFIYQNRELLQKGGNFTQDEILNITCSVYYYIKELRERNERAYQCSLEFLTTGLEMRYKDRYFAYHEELLPLLLEKIEVYQTNQHLVETTLACALKLYFIVKDQDARNQVFYQGCFRNIQTIMRSQKTSISLAAMEFLLQIYKFHLDGMSYEPYSLDELKELTTEIQYQIHQSHPLSRPLTFPCHIKNWDVFIFIRDGTENEVVKSWATWVIEQKSQKFGLKYNFA